MLVELFKTILYLSYMAVVTIAIIALIKLFVGKKFSARWNYIIWFLLIVRLAIPFSIPFPYSVFNLIPQNSHVTELIRDNGYSIQNAEGNNKGIEPSTTVNPNTPANPLTPINNGTVKDNKAVQPLNSPITGVKALNPWEIASYVWLAGFAALMVFYTVCYASFWRRINKYSVKGEACLDELIDACTKKSGLRAKPRVLIADCFSSPFVFSLFKPVVVIPAHMVETLMDSSKEHILLHELMHIKWRDYRINQLLLLLTAMHWFNPALWYAFKVLKKDCELACDESVLECISNKEHKEYANTLLKIAQVQNNFKLQYSILSFGESNIKRRIKQIMKFKKSSIGIVIVAVLIIAAILVVVMTGGKINLGIKSPAANVSDVSTEDTGKNEPVKETDSFESSKLGLSITFPESWKGKYKVNEGYSSLTICFKPEVQIEEGKGMLFVILEKTKDVDEGHIDNVQYFEANGKTYITGGPTDVTYQREDPEFDTFTKLQAEVPEVLKTLKSIKAAEAAPIVEEYKLADYFPFEKDIHLKYKGTNSEYAEYETYVDFVTEDSIQIRNDNPGVMSVIVYNLKNGELKKVFNGGEGAYKHNYLSARNQDEVVLKEPLKVGNEWKLKSGDKRSITSLDAEIETPAGKYKAIEVKTEGKDFVITDYYAKGIGLIKNVYKAKEGDFTVLSELEKMERNVPYIHNMRVYFSDYGDDKIFYQDRKVEINSNEDIKFKLQKELKTPPTGSSMGSLISANTQIRSIVAEDKSDTVTVDFSEHLVNEMNAGAGAEMAIIKCLANTFGKYYERNKVIITINGKPYESGHEIMKPGEYLTVDDKNCTEYKK